MSVLRFDLTRFEAAIEHLLRLASLDREQVLADSVDLLAERALERIERTKVAPSGSAWPERKRPAPHPVLVESGALLRSIEAFAFGDHGEVSSALPYADVQQSRFPFLGISTIDGDDVEDLAARRMYEAFS